MTILRKLPHLLIYTRLLLGIAIGILAVHYPAHFQSWIIILMTLGILTDIFDGVIARRLRVSTRKLRILDSNVDQFFWLVTAGAILYFNPDFLMTHIGWISAIVLLEVTTYMVSFYRFGRPIATHSFLAKIWSVSLFAFLIDLSLTGNGGFLFWACMILGIISRLEILGIVLRLKRWAFDVPTILAVSRINAGVPVAG